MSDELNAGVGHDLPDVGTRVVHHRQFGEPLVGEVVPTETWKHPNELTPDSFVVDFGERRSRYTADQAAPFDEVVHIGP